MLRLGETKSPGRFRPGLLLAVPVSGIRAKNEL
jgi:hypothetical protein